MRYIPRTLQAADPQAGFILPGVIAFILAIAIIGGATITIILTNFSIVGNNVRSQQALNIAEGGINYYLWHLSHNATDYKDGQSTPTTPDPTLGYGPYVHSYIDDNAITTGTYTLWIKPQGNGSSLVTVRSIGQVTGSNTTRTVQAQVGAASFASYGLVADTEFWIGSSEAANGPVFSNVGVHVDGSNSDTVASANASYTPQSQYGGDGGTHPGVWCSNSVTTPVNCATRNKTSWTYPKTTVDFNQVSTSLCTMKKTALSDFSANACTQLPATRTSSYIPERSTTFSATKGYLIQLNPAGTYDLYKVDGENDKAADYTTALAPQAIATGIAIPSSGVIFVEDNVWVRTNPTFHGRVTIASGRLADSSTTHITVADDVLYSAKDGSDAIGLVAEKDVIIAPYAPPNTNSSFTFEVDAAALAQSGSVTWPQYYSGTSTCTRGWVDPSQKLIFYGSVATRLDWTWNYQVGNCGNAVRDSSNGNYFSGIEHTQTNYDYNLLYSPPPSYPITGTYNILNWREVLVRP
jgi:Tfp pilus assembly protein PilX